MTTKTMTFSPGAPPDTLKIYAADRQGPGQEVIRIDPSGRLFWHGREVETDNEFRKAMLELRDYFMGAKHGNA